MNPRFKKIFRRVVSTAGIVTSIISTYAGFLPAWANLLVGGLGTLLTRIPKAFDERESTPPLTHLSTDNDHTKP